MRQPSRMMTRPTFLKFSLTLSVFSLFISGSVYANHSTYDFMPCSPESEFAETPEGGPDLSFCAQWNPEFDFRGHRCCSRPVVVRKKRKDNRCAPTRIKATYCDEMTDEQRAYSEMAASGKLGDLITLISQDISKRKSAQAFCSVDNGFLAGGRRVVPTSQNHLKLRSPEKCTDFGTDELVGALEWVGRKIGDRMPASGSAQTHLMIGDMSAPRGGCISGRGGKRAHRSHTSGQDVDLGFLNPGDPDFEMRGRFDPANNWWFIKQLFSNPFVCVKRVFVDKKIIRRIASVAAHDPMWREVRPFLQHMKGHKNHFHLRVGQGPGQPGCPNDAFTDDEDEEESPNGANSLGDLDLPLEPITGNAF